MTQLSSIDVKTLMREPSAQMRGVLASKIAAEYRLNRFSRAEETLANDIFRILLKDAQVSIRAAVAQQLAHCPSAPHDIILQLANDISEVAAPVLQHSSVLSEEDLVAIVRSTHEVLKLCAIAERPTVSEVLAQSLMDTGKPIVLQHLFGNRGAAFNSIQLMHSWNLIAEQPSLLEALVARGGLSLGIAEKIYHVASDEMRHSLSKQYKLDIPTVKKASGDAREWSVLDLASASDTLSSDEQVEDFVDGLHFNGRLTHSLLMRALCTGNLAVFEYGIAKMAGVPRINARILLMEGSGRGLAAIYKAAVMPEGFFEAVKTLLRISLEESDFGRTQSSDFRKKVIERIYMEKYNRTVENMEYLLSIIGGKVPARAHVH